MASITQYLLFICLLAASLFAVVVIIVLTEALIFLITDRIKDVYRYACGRHKDHGEKEPCQE